MGRGGTFKAHPTPKKGWRVCLSHRGTDIEHYPKAPRGLRQSAGVWQTESQGQGRASTCSSWRVPLQVWRHIGWGCRPHAWETRTIVFGLSANTVVCKHLLLSYLSSSRCPQAFLWNTRDYPHTLFLICVYSSLEKAQRTLFYTLQLNTTKLNTPASEEEFRQLVPYNWSPISPYTFLLIFSIITWAAWSSQSLQFPWIHFQMAILERAWALDQAVSAWCNPCHYWWLPWNARVQLAGPDQGLPRPSPGGQLARGRYWSGPFITC